MTSMSLSTCVPNHQDLTESTSLFVGLAFNRTVPVLKAPPTGIAVEAAVVDVLAPDNMGERARLDLGAGRPIEAPGTTQALRRSSVVIVDLAGARAEIRRPDVIGALLGKAAAVMRIFSQTAAGRAKHLHDFDSLARLLGVADRRSADLTRSERKTIAVLGEAPELSELAGVSLRVLLDGEAS